MFFSFMAVTLHTFFEIAVVVDNYDLHFTDDYTGSGT